MTFLPGPGVTDERPFGDRAEWAIVCERCGVRLAYDDSDWVCARTGGGHYCAVCAPGHQVVRGARRS